MLLSETSSSTAESTAPISAPKPLKTADHGRSLLIDVVRGLAIGLVALGHTNQGEISRGWWGTSAFGHNLDLFIYSFHMPAFFLLSGVFLRSSAEKRGAWQFTLQKIRTILWPFWVWSLLLPFAPLLFGSYMRTPPAAMHDVLLNLVTGSMAWFLPSLFVALVLGMLLRRLPVALTVPISAVVVYYLPAFPMSALFYGIRFLPFVLLGMGLRGSLGRLNRVPAAACLVLATLAGVGLYAMVIYVNPGFWANILYVPKGFLGTVMLLFIGQAFGTGPVARGLGWAGAASLGIFLLSPFPQGFFRSLLLAGHITQPVVQLLVPTAAAMILPAWLYHRRDTLHLGWTFTMPEFRRSRNAPGEPVTPR